MPVPLRTSEWVAASALGALCTALGVVAGVEPSYAVFGALGLAFVLLTFVDLAAGLVILIFVAFTESTPLGAGALSLTKLTGLLLVLAWIARLATQRAGRERLIFDAYPALSYVLLIFVAWAVGSTVWAENGDAALSHSSRLLLVAILYIVVYTVVRGRREAGFVIGGLAAGATFTAAYGLVLRPGVSATESGRLVSTVQDPNFLAALLVAGVALTVAGFFAARGSAPLRLAAASGATLCLTAFFLTGSRGGIVAFAVALLATVAFGGRARGRALIATALIALVAVMYYAVYAPPEIRDRIVSATQGEAQREEGRLTIWTVGWRMFEDNAVAGVGAGNFGDRSIEYVLEPGTVFRTDRVIDNPDVAHNTYLGIGAELGLVGAALYLTIVGVSTACALQAAHRFAAHGDWRMEILTRGALVAQAGLLTANFFVNGEVNKVTWLVLALGPALLSLARAGEPARADPR
ncbi:MAG: O-antigen ligase family protein [Solirubrobacterales bacterium]